jgi:hypothetical protein
MGLDLPGADPTSIRKASLKKLLNDFEVNNELNLEKLKIGNVNILYPSFGSLALHPRKYSKTKRFGTAVNKVWNLKEDMKKIGVQAKFLDQDFLLKAGIVGGGFGIGYKE